MKSWKKTTVIGLIILAISTSVVTAFAASQYSTPAEALAGITGRTVESVTDERTETGKTYGAIASEADKLDEFKAEMLQMKKDILSAQVASGTIKQEKADTIIAALEENQAKCDGTGSARIGKAMGAMFGANGTGAGNGCAGKGNGMGGKGNGIGRGQRSGCGMGRMR